jgi:hypothetical protein
MNVANPHSNQPNDTRLDDLKKEVREFGRQAAAGLDSLPMLAVKVAYAAAAGVISADKDADGVDDANRLYEEFFAAMSKKSVHEQTKDGKKANTSKLRQIIIAASKPTCDFPTTLGKVLAARKSALTLDPKAKVKGAYPAYVDAARAQTQQDDDLSDEQIKEVIQKPESADKTLEDLLSTVDKTLESIITGENKHGIKDQSDEIVQAHGMIRQKLAALTLAKDVEATMKKARELGLIKDEVVTPEVTAVDQQVAA